MGDGYVGNAADSQRIRRLNDKRKEEQKDNEDAKAKREASAGVSRLLGFAKSKTEVVEMAFKRETVGLQTASQFTEKKNSIEAQVIQEQELRRRCAEEAELRDKQKKRQKKKKALVRLSFVDDDEVEEEEEEEDEGEKQEVKKLKFGAVGKNPNAVTGFLPDRDRDREERQLKEKLKGEWEAKQNKVKEEQLEVTYSYWDGAGHRKTLQLKKGNTIGEFLKAVREQLSVDYREMRTASVENLIYIKEDLIIPHEFSFYWMIVNKARGKSGPLFNFDVHEDVRMVNDASVEKDESHAGKVVERHWYDKNKHIFPASRWEVFDPTKNYGSYTIHGDEEK
mmetsp:Transcript_25225/g.42264  ORF Transcript_25225/g.42264 Transcript_25225/m.42264 type:complete len:337 (+) Transcript_25225:163-1173(+)|eukprot:CAMPEP_0198197224 /NCGR_PEP_ID=MMETSP1445-20131203/816_1 /TAXON_ID=36898 /ORGANISM="Pyramimonas sp., Strain CCMP2087" /LENGTH=336 /DNA_ID=CAMNT_0043866433 /DNA_START=159 /DNA_END=1169 /DNA_ORIENTATION=+